MGIKLKKVSTIPSLLKKLYLSPEDVTDILIAMNYRYWVIDQWDLKPVPRQLPIYNNWLCIPYSVSKEGMRISHQIRRRLISSAVLPLIGYLNPAVVINKRS